MGMANESGGNVFNALCVVKWPSPWRRVAPPHSVERNGSSKIDHADLASLAMECARLGTGLTTSCDQDDPKQ